MFHCTQLQCRQLSAPSLRVVVFRETTEQALLPSRTCKPAISGFGSCLGALYHGYDNVLIKEAIVTSAPAKVLLAKESGQVPMRGLGEGRADHR